MEPFRPPIEGRLAAELAFDRGGDHLAAESLDFRLDRPGSAALHPVDGEIGKKIPGQRELARRR